MGDGTEQLQDLVTLHEGAKKFHMDRARFFSICDRAGILIPWGGTEAHPRFKVKLSDAENAILMTRKSLRPARPIVGHRVHKLDPLVRC